MRGKNASALSCKLGYKLYTLGGRPSRDTINEHLVRHGHDAVSQRTYDNYVKQRVAGVTWRDYVSINRWDYFHASVPGEFIDASAQEVA